MNKKKMNEISNTMVSEFVLIIYHRRNCEKNKINCKVHHIIIHLSTCLFELENEIGQGEKKNLQKNK